jgi:hypothetical protein
MVWSEEGDDESPAPSAQDSGAEEEETFGTLFCENPLSLASVRSRVLCRAEVPAMGPLLGPLSLHFVQVEAGLFESVPAGWVREMKDTGRHGNVLTWARESGRHSHRFPTVVPGADRR